MSSVRSRRSKTIPTAALVTFALLPGVVQARPHGGLHSMGAAPTRAATVPASAWSAMQDQEVELVLADDTIVIGKLVAQDTKTVTIVERTRDVTVVPKAKVAALRVADDSAAGSTPGTPPPLPPAVETGGPPPLPGTQGTAQPPAPTPPVTANCAGLECVTGSTAVDTPVPQDEAALSTERAGKWTMVGGAAGFGLGIILVGAGFGAAKKLAPNCFACTDEPGKYLAATRTILSGYVFLALGGVTVITGGVLYGVAHPRAKRAREARAARGVSLTPLARGMGLSLSGRF